MMPTHSEESETHAMKHYDTIFFDLDGTLTDPGLGITNAVAYALEKFGIPIPPRTELYKFIGPPLAPAFQEFYGFSAAQAEQAVTFYREYFRDRGIFENVVYDGIDALLAHLTAAGKTAVLATSKPEVFAQRILDHFHLSSYFSLVAGATMDSSRSAKGDVIAYALGRCGRAGQSRIVMVGDRKHDILGAAQNGLDSIGVLYGYGDRAELESAGATYIAPTVADLEALLLSK